MIYQMSLFDTNLKKTDDDNAGIKILIWNIQNPSSERAKNQANWIIGINPNILILTEVKYSSGFAITRAMLEICGYKFIYNKSSSYFTVIALKNINYKERKLNLTLEQERVAFVELDLYLGKVLLMGAYVPANSRDTDKLIKKKKFQDDFMLEIKKEVFKNSEKLNLIIAGDLNILEPSHKPSYPQFERWNYFYDFFQNNGFVDIFKYINPNKDEYSWMGQGQPQRLDHAFISQEIIKYVNRCEYIHYPRLNKLSDHSAMIIVL